MITVLPYRIYDVFTAQPYGGNPLAIVFEGHGLRTEQMQTIAGEFNLSETVFVLPAQQSTNHAHLRIFTPSAELPFAGHPTVGAALCIARRRGFDTLELRLEEAAGLVHVALGPAEHVTSQTATLRAAQGLEIGAPSCDREQAAALLTLPVQELVGHPFIASAGTPFTFFELRSLEALARASFSTTTWAELGRTPLAGRAYCFWAGDSGADPRARLFAPALGINEDPATGSAAVALAGCLALKQGGDGEFEWRLEQGIEMGRPSELYISATVRGAQLTAMRVGGAAVEVARGQIAPPP